MGEGGNFGRVNFSSTANLNPPDGSDGKDQETLVIVVSALLGSSLLVNFMFVGGILMEEAVGIFPNEISVQSNLQKFTYKELSEATNGF